MSNRRAYVEKRTPAEAAIKAAMVEVEKMPADERLSNVLFDLERAFNRVADYVDEKQADNAP